MNQTEPYRRMYCKFSSPPDRLVEVLARVDDLVAAKHPMLPQIVRDQGVHVGIGVASAAQCHIRELFGTWVHLYSGKCMQPEIICVDIVGEHRH